MDDLVDDEVEEDADGLVVVVVSAMVGEKRQSARRSAIRITATEMRCGRLIAAGGEVSLENATDATNQSRSSLSFLSPDCRDQ